MKLGEKIAYARKKAGLSQIDLADELGVSRQSVSKWETEEANPDITKLSSIAKVLNVTTDWLLSDEDPVPDNEAKDIPVSEKNTYPEWMEHLPKSILRMAKQYGWIYGVRTAIGGLLFATFGVFARILSHHFIFLGDSYVPAGVYDPFTDIRFGFSALTGLTIGIGVAILIFGIILAISLKKWGEKQ